MHLFGESYRILSSQPHSSPASSASATAKDQGKAFIISLFIWGFGCFINQRNRIDLEVWMCILCTVVNFRNRGALVLRKE